MAYKFDGTSDVLHGDFSECYLPNTLTIFVDPLSSVLLWRRHPNMRTGLSQSHRRKLIRELLRQPLYVETQ